MARLSFLPDSLPVHLSSLHSMRDPAADLTTTWRLRIFMSVELGTLTLNTLQSYKVSKLGISNKSSDNSDGYKRYQNWGFVSQSDDRHLGCSEHLLDARNEVWTFGCTVVGSLANNDGCCSEAAWRTNDSLTAHWSSYVRRGDDQQMGVSHLPFPQCYRKLLN